MTGTTDPRLRMFPLVCYLQSVGEFVPFIWLRDGQLLPHVVDPHLALVVPGRHMEAALGPGDSVESSSALHRDTGAGDLGVLITRLHYSLVLTLTQ